MPSAPAGQRVWKCPECGTESSLSVTQLDPLACDACLAKMKNAGKSGGVTAVVSGPFAMWQGLPEATKLGAVVVALMMGLLVGFMAGKSMPRAASSINQIHHANEAQQAPESSNRSEKSTSEDVLSQPTAEERPPAPGPGYKWVQGRKRKDGTRGAGHWAPEKRKADDDSSSR